MDCETLEALAIELVYNELDAQQTAEAEQHMLECNRCSALVARLRVGLHAANTMLLEEPPASLESQILAAIATQKPSHSPNWSKRIMHFLSIAGSYAMRPQYAMAVVFVLLVGSSALLLRTRSLPIRTTATRVTEDGVPVTEAMKEALPTQEGAPALIQRPTSPAVTASMANAPTPIAKAETIRIPSVPSIANEEMNPRSVDKDKQNKKEETPVSTSEAESNNVESKDVAIGREAPPLSSAIAGAAPQTAAPIQVEKSQLSMQRQAGSGAAQEAGPSLSFAQNMALYRAGRYAESAQNFDRLSRTGTQTVTSLLYAARSYKNLGNCAQALARYQRIVNVYGLTTEANLAAQEGAQCAKQLGDVATAQSLLEKAKNNSAKRSRGGLNQNTKPSPTAPANPQQQMQSNEPTAPHL